MKTRLWFGVAAMVLGGSLALAQPSPDKQKIAEDEFNKGNTAYNLGRFDESVDHFTKAYEAWPQPEFLYNIAQAYRLGGNCKQAVYFYKRFRSLKERDTEAPLSPQKKAEVDKFINDLAECAAKADTGANAQPQSLDRPTGTSTTTTTPTATTTATKPEPLETADEGSDEADVGEEDDGGEVHTQLASGPTMVSARLESGIALLGGGEGLEFPIQPVVALTAGYPIPVGPATIEAGVGLSYTPLPYEAMGAQKQGTMLGARAVGVISYPVAPKVSLRGQLGVGVVSLSGLAMGNPITTDRTAGSFTLLNVRVGVAADYAITQNIVATLQPFALAYSPGADGMYADSLREIDVLLGVGYRQ